MPCGYGLLGRSGRGCSAVLAGGVFPRRVLCIALPRGRLRGGLFGSRCRSLGCPCAVTSFRDESVGEVVVGAAYGEVVDFAAAAVDDACDFACAGEVVSDGEVTDEFFCAVCEEEWLAECGVDVVALCEDGVGLAVVGLKAGKDFGGGEGAVVLCGEDGVTAFDVADGLIACGGGDEGVSREAEEAACRACEDAAEKSARGCGAGFFACVAEGGKCAGVGAVETEGGLPEGEGRFLGEFLCGSADVHVLGGIADLRVVEVREGADVLDILFSISCQTIFCF